MRCDRKHRAGKSDKRKAGLLGLTAIQLLFFSAFLLVFCQNQLWAQTQVKADIFFSPYSRTITVNQELVYHNQTKDTLHTLYLNDWNNAFSSKKSPLAKQFTAEYQKRFHYASADERGETKVNYIQSAEGKDYIWKRPQGSPDLLEIMLQQALPPGESSHIFLDYTLRIPEDRFTGFGVDDQDNFNLRHWLIVPAVYYGEWHLYNHQNLNAEYLPPVDYRLTLKMPASYTAYSNINRVEERVEDQTKIVQLKEDQQNNTRIAFVRNPLFDEFKKEELRIVSNIREEKVSDKSKETAVFRIAQFLEDRLGTYPHANLMITEADYKSNPIFGLNQLPPFLSPFSADFKYELKTLKVLTQAYLRNSFFMDLYQEEWVVNAMGMYLLMEYIEEYYPEEKIIGKLSRWIGLKWTHLADMDFNEQFPFFYMNMNRLNLDQPLSMRKDSLVRFNREVANPYKAGIGLNYLGDYSEKQAVDSALKDFYQTYKGKAVGGEDFKNTLQNHIEKDIHWFFEDYVHSNKRIDFTIDGVKSQGDSLTVRIKNKENNTMPVSLYGLHKKEVRSTDWVERDGRFSKITIPKKNITRLGLNYEGIIPEFNQRNNYKNLKGLLNKPLQFRLFTDVEDPHYSQFFLMPEFTYNLYDGFTMGTGITNQSLLLKNFQYNLTPQYGFLSKTLIGGFIMTNRHQFRNRNLSSIVYGVSGNRYSYSYDLYYHRLTPFVRFNWRHRDLRNRERQSLSLRNVMVHRDQSELTDLTNRPNYNVLDLRYSYSDRNLVNTLYSTVDYQLGKKFSKVSFTAKFRQLFLNNRQLELRFFAGAFLYNKTDSDYFSFALDRPSDYLFDYNYYGRSEGSGLFSQQFIEAEGGFKSQIEPGFANAWMATFNSSTSLYRDWLYFYGDFGMLKNKAKTTKFHYDTGLRLSLVQDYFEVFFPVYSSLGWEIGQPHYDKKIRFIITLDFQTLMGLFERTYY